MEAEMTNDATDAPAERPQARPGWGERLAWGGFALVVMMVVHLALLISLPPLVGRDAGRTMAKGLSAGVFLFVLYGPYTLRSFSGYAAFFLAFWAVCAWLVE